MKEEKAPKPVKFIGRAQDELRDFPADARADAGHQIYLVQLGDTPAGAKSMSDVGRGVWEIRIAENSSWFRVFYIAELSGKVCVLHCFQKKSNTTPKTALKTGISRYRTAVEEAKNDQT